MSPEAAQQLTDLLSDPEEAEAVESGNSSAGRRGRVAGLSLRLRRVEPELYRHSHRVAHWARRIALRMGFKPKALRVLNLAARFHDVGKIPFLNLVHKPGPLTFRERELLGAHAALGAKMLSAMAPPFRDAAPIVRAHHNRYDEDGKPSLLGARVIAVADAYDAMVSPRPYHEVRTPQGALREILRQSGGQFDPAVVAAFVDLDLFGAVVDRTVLEAMKAGARALADSARGRRRGVGQEGAPEQALAEDDPCAPVRRARRIFSDSAGDLWEAIEVEGPWAGVAPGFRRIVLQSLDDPEAGPAPGPITVTPLESLPSEHLRGFGYLVLGHADPEPVARKDADGPQGVPQVSGEAAGSPGAVSDESPQAAADEPATPETQGEEEGNDAAREGDASRPVSTVGQDEPAVAGLPTRGGDGLDAPAEEEVAEPEILEEPIARRHLYRGIETERLVPHRFRARVRIALHDEEFEGAAEAAHVPGARAEVAARATLEALRKAEGDHVDLALQGAKVVRVFDRSVVVVGVYALKGRDMTPLVGACLVRDSVEHAAVLATLQATNRWVTWAAIRRASTGRDG